MIVEGTAGNTGIGLTMVGNAKGYTSVIVMPDTQSQEKKDVLRIFGADLRLVPAKPYKDPGNYVRYSERLAAELAATHEAGGSGPTSSTTQPTCGAITARPDRKSGNRRAAASTGSLVPSGQAARSLVLANI